MFNTIIAADIGATNARFATLTRAADGKPYMMSAVTYASARYEQLEVLVAKFMADVANLNPDAIVLALPGPVVNGCCKTTNLPWQVCIEQLEGIFQRPVFLLNDLEAQAWGIDCITAGKLMPLYSGTSLPQGNRCIIAPGSDLGEALLYWDGIRYHPFATEGGHCDFASTNDFETALARLLQDQYGHARWGHVLSGPGIANLYRLLSKDGDCCISGEKVGELYRQNQPDAVAAVEHFFELLGRECANLVLKSMATGGVYISGGIVPKLYSKGVASHLVKSFLSRPSMQELLNSTPVYLVMEPELGLIGAANYLWQRPTTQ